MSKRTEKIEQEIEDTRSRMDRTIDEIGDRLSPERLRARGKEFLKARAPVPPVAGSRFHQRRPMVLGATALGLGMAAGYFLSPVRGIRPEPSQPMTAPASKGIGDRHTLPPTRAEIEMRSEKTDVHPQTASERRREEAPPEGGRPTPPMAAPAPGGGAATSHGLPSTRAEREMAGHAPPDRPTEPKEASGMSGSSREVPGSGRERPMPVSRPGRPSEDRGASSPGGQRGPGQADRPEKEPRPPDEAGAQQGPNPQRKEGQRKEEPQTRDRGP